jgi:CRISPR-associated endonuclease/helicase Cas3
VVAFALPLSGEAVPITGDFLDRDPRAKAKLEAALKGATLVVDARIGGLRHGLLHEASDEAFDVGAEEGALPFRVRTATATTPEGAGAVDPQRWREELRLAVESDPDGNVTRWLVVETDRARTPTTEEGRSNSTPQTLSDHQASARQHARDLGVRLGLPERYVGLLELAAVLHDEGKRAQRWQRAFNAPEGGPWGKTASRPNQKILDGYRHELGSLPYAERDPRVAALDESARDLCLHLIAAHHGYARPVIPTRSCDDAPPTALAGRAHDVAQRFARLERQWGPWGLAWWEAVLRAADQRASRENDERRATDG